MPYSDRTNRILNLIKDGESWNNKNTNVAQDKCEFDASAPPTASVHFIKHSAVTGKCFGIILLKIPWSTCK